MLNGFQLAFCFRKLCIEFPLDAPCNARKLIINVARIGTGKRDRLGSNRRIQAAVSLPLSPLKTRASRENHNV